MPRILMTGASGGIGTALRKLLPPIYPDLLLSDLKPPADLGFGGLYPRVYWFRISCATCWQILSTSPTSFG